MTPSFLKTRNDMQRLEEVDLLRPFEKTFQVKAMKDNITIPLFPKMQDPKTINIVELDFIIKDGASDPNDSMEVAIEQSLNRSAILYTCPTKPATPIVNL